jgi:hypothetical protein
LALGLGAMMYKRFKENKEILIEATMKISKWLSTKSEVQRAQGWRFSCMASAAATISWRRVLDG